MAVQFVLLLFFKTKDNMKLEFHLGLSSVGIGRSNGVLEDMCGDILAVLSSGFDVGFFVAFHLRGRSGASVIVQIFPDARYRGFRGSLYQHYSDH